MGDVETIERAKRAWRRIRKRGRTIFAEWLLVGQAISIGRARALAEAGCARPYGVRYHKAMAAFLQETGFDEIGDDERHKALRCFEQREAILAWIATLPPDRQRTLNHPNYVLSLFKGTRTLQGTRTKPQHVAERRAEPKAFYGPRPERPSGDMIKRVGQALGSSRCVAPGSDLFGAASAAIEALTIEDHIALARIKGAALKMSTARPAQLAMELQ